MTIDELRDRKQELLASKKHELDLMARGQGDEIALAMIDEELLDVSAQLRALTPTHRVGGGRTTNSPYAADQQQFIDWARQDPGEEADEPREHMRKILSDCIGSISSRQREILLLWSKGLSGNEIAERMGIDSSTVSRTLKRAQNRVRRVAEIRMAVSRLRDGNRLDMADPEASRLLMSVLTVHQAVCFYLYYSERLSTREIGSLLQLDHSTVFRTIQRSVLRIHDALRGEVDTLDNADALDNLAFAVYRGLCERGGALPPAFAARLMRAPAPKYIGRKRYSNRRERMSLRRPALMILSGRGGRVLGELLQTLVERYRNAALDGTKGWSHPIVRWLVHIFQAVTNREKKH